MICARYALEKGFRTEMKSMQFAIGHSDVDGGRPYRLNAKLAMMHNVRASISVPELGPVQQGLL